MKDNELPQENEIPNEMNLNISDIKREMQELLREPRFIKAIYQFGLLMIGYFVLSVISDDYSVTNTLFYMGLFFLFSFLIPLPRDARIKGEAFNEQSE